MRVDAHYSGKFEPEFYAQQHAVAAEAKVKKRGKLSMGKRRA
jgi:hypothetical protein